MTIDDPRTTPPRTTPPRPKSSAGFRPRTAEQLPRPDREPVRNVGRGLLAVLGVLMLMIGVPAALILFVGNPLPTSMPDASWLQADLTAEAVISVFAVLVWIIWAHFAICMITEAKAMRSGRMPGSVMLGSASQLLARRLIAGILLLSGTATATGTTPESPFGEQHTSVVGTSVSEVRTDDGSRIDMRDLVRDGRINAGDDPETRAGAALEEIAADAEQDREAAATAESAPATKFYEVKPPSGRNYDTLWDISERHLGDPFRYKEIFELNRDRLQPDGRRLVDADLIHPGWELIMPADAEGPDISEVAVAAPPGAHAEPAPAVDPAQEAATQAATSQAAQASSGVSGMAESAGAQADVEQVGTAAADAADLGQQIGRFGPMAGSDGIPAITARSEVGTELRRGQLGEIALGGGLILAGILVALGARRGPYGTPEGSDQALRVESRAGRADLLDRALRGLAKGRAEQGQPLPDIAAVYLNDDQVVVHVAGQPAPPPAPWAQADEGRSWTVRAAALPQDPARPIGPAPWPALVCIAESHGYDLLVDLEYAPGLISLAGDTGIGRAVAHAIAADLVTHPWSDDVSVTMVGFSGDIDVLDHQRIHHVDTIEQAIAEAEQAAGEQDELLRRLGVDGVLSGRSSGAATHLKPQVLILSGAPSPDQIDRLNELVAHGRSVITAVCVGNAHGARWRFTCDPGGGIDLGALGASGTARRLSAQAVTDIRALLADAQQEAGQRATEAAVRRPAAVASSVARPVRETREPVDASSAPARVVLLGPVQVHAQNAPPSGREPLMTELISLVALHPDGVHESVVKVSLWPRGVEDQVVRETLTTAQNWIGQDASGRPLLARGDDERWRLNPLVHIDWHEFADAAAGDSVGDPERLLSALDAGQGAAFSAIPPGRYAWLAFHQAAREARVLATSVARHAAQQFVAAGEKEKATATLRRGLRMVPAAQALWRDLIRLTGDDGPGGVSALITEMAQELGAVPWEPETLSLVEHVDPRADEIS